MFKTASKEKIKVSHIILVGIHEGKRFRRLGEFEGIKLKVILKNEDVDWIQQTQDS
jgi:hypothetical protein